MAHRGRTARGRAETAKGLRRKGWAVTLGALSASVLAAAGLAGPAAASTRAAATADAAAATTAHRPAAPAPHPVTAPLAQKPYLGWSSWSLESTNYPGVNPDGSASYLTEAHVLQQAKILASTFKKHGYDYVNIDAGWTTGFDAYGRPVPDAKRFPDGIKYVNDKLHALGLKAGIYQAVGLDPTAYGDGTTPVHGAPGCTTADVVYPDLRKTNGWDSAYKIDYSRSCARKYTQSVADLYASWGVDFLKLDGVGPGSFKGGADYDNRDDAAAWRAALNNTGRPIQFTLSWALSHTYADAWKKDSNGWRVDTDVECYCDTLVTWDASVKQRWRDVVQWIPDAGPGHWNNLDSVDVGSGRMDGLTEDERQSYLTLWAIEAAPLYIGDDLTQLDSYGEKLLTNDDVIAIDQAGRPAKPVSQSSEQQTWYARNADGSYTVALFNLGSSPARATARWQDLGFGGAADVKDVWSHQDLGATTGSFGATLPAHGSRLLTVTPRKTAHPTVPTGAHGTSASATSVSLAWGPAVPAKGASVARYDIRDNGARVASTGGAATSATVSGLAPGSGHRYTVTAVDTHGRTSGPSTAVPVTTADTGGPVTYQGEDATLAGGATASDCGGCAGGKKAGNLGGSATVTFDHVTAPRDGTYLVTVAYADGDTSRQGVVTVDGRTIQLPFSGTGDNDWDHTQNVTVPMALKAGDNSVSFGNPGDSVADIDQIVVQ
ncbi:fibronectin type III domain-containing protein [Streptomyces sp. DW26H14]|uniref:fibronectin type III domain-containing protein n=1 Tax=Streptomyces sp. DW26H14 TaxID=3435395 RepID=UPI00403DE1AD